MSKKVLFILMPKDYRDEEFYFPYKILKNTGNHVDVAGFSEGEATGAKGYRHTPNLLLNNLSNEDFDQYDALVIPGGPASTTYLWDNKKIQSIVQYFHKKNKLVATICYANIVPVQADILKNKKATVYPTQEAKEILKKHDVEYVNAGCIKLDKENIITAQGPKYAKEFGETILL
jgi:protease I